MLKRPMNTKLYFIIKLFLKVAVSMLPASKVGKITDLSLIFQAKRCKNENNNERKLYRRNNICLDSGAGYNLLTLIHAQWYLMSHSKDPRIHVCFGFLFIKSLYQMASTAL